MPLCQFHGARINYNLVWSQLLVARLFHVWWSPEVNSVVCLLCVVDYICTSVSHNIKLNIQTHITSPP